MTKSRVEQPVKWIKRNDDEPQWMGARTVLETLSVRALPGRPYLSLTVMVQGRPSHHPHLKDAGTLTTLAEALSGRGRTQTGSHLAQCPQAGKMLDWLPGPAPFTLA